MLISKTDLNYLRLAKEAALSSKCRWQLGSVLVTNGNVMAISPNKIRHHPKWIQIYTLHAENAVLTLAPKTKGATIYVVRVGADGSIRNSKPCSKCLKLLFEADVNRVVWSSGGGGYESARIRKMFENDKILRTDI